MYTYVVDYKNTPVVRFKRIIVSSYFVACLIIKIEVILTFVVGIRTITTPFVLVSNALSDNNL